MNLKALRLGGAQIDQYGNLNSSFIGDPDHPKVRLPGTGGLERTDSELARAAAARDGEIRKQEYERDAMAAKGPEEALRVAEERQAENARRRKEALDLQNEEDRIAARADEARKGGTDTTARRQALLAKKQILEDKIAAYDKADANTPDFGLNQALAQGSRDKLQEVDLALAELPAATGDGGRMQELLGSPSELQQIKAKIEAIAQLRAAITGLGEAQAALAQNKDEAQGGRLKAAVDQAKDDRKQAELLAAQAGVSEGARNPRLAQDLETRKNELEARRTEDLDPLAAKQREDDMKAAERSVATARLDAESAVASLRLTGQEREEKLLEIERRKLQVKIQGDAIGRDDAERQKATLDAQAAALARDGQERRDELAGALAVSKLRRAEEEARLAGDPARAETMRKAAEDLDDTRARADAVKEAENARLTPQERANYVENKVKDLQEAREQARLRAEEERKAGRNRETANLGSGLSALEAEKARLQGNTRGADRIQEDAARTQDELDRTEAEKRLVEQGFGKAAAGKMAGRQVKMAQANRMMDLLGGQTESIVASSLAKIGGGGNVTGTDPNTRLLEQVTKLLEDILDADKKVVRLEMLP